MREEELKEVIGLLVEERFQHIKKGEEVWQRGIEDGNNGAIGAGVWIGQRERVLQYVIDLLKAEG